MDKDLFYIYTQWTISPKKEWNNAICSNMDGPRDNHTKWSKTEKDMISLIYGILKSIQMNLFTKRLTDTECIYMVIKQAMGDILGVWD